MLLYAIGDIHGCSFAMTKLLNIIEADRAGEDAKIVFLGDYVDRGPDSSGVIEHLRILAANRERKNVEYVFLLGNHEDMMLDHLSGSVYGWNRNGGKQTLESYEATGRDIDDDARWIKDHCRLVHQHGEFVFVHAGLNPSTPLTGHVKGDLIWSRDWIDYDGEFYDNYFVIHGHTPVSRPQINKNQVNIDTGCVFGKHYPEYGNLTAVRIDSRDSLTFFQTRQDEIILP